MKCPHCKKNLTMVDVYSECYQEADIDDEGNIVKYYSVEDLSDEATDVECNQCHKSIIKNIKSF